MLLPFSSPCAVPLDNFVTIPELAASKSVFDDTKSIDDLNGAKKKHVEQFAIVRELIGACKAAVDDLYNARVEVNAHVRTIEPLETLIRN